MILRKSFYIRWSAGRSPRVHEVNPGRDPSNIPLCLKFPMVQKSCHLDFLFGRYGPNIRTTPRQLIGT